MNPHRPDIATRADIELFVDGFYTRVRRDALLGPIFDDVAHVDWEEHLSKMYDFWESVLFGAARFRGNPLAVHLALSHQVQLGAAEFDRWLELFFETIDAGFSGPCAEDTKVRAARIAGVMRHHISVEEVARQWA